MPQTHAYAPSDQPLVEVLHDGTWCWGELRMVTLHDDDRLDLQVRYHPAPGSAFIDRFPLEQVRPLDEHTGALADPAQVWPWNRGRRDAASDPPAHARSREV